MQAPTGEGFGAWGFVVRYHYFILRAGPATNALVVLTLGLNAGLILPAGKLVLLPSWSCMGCRGVGTAAPAVVHRGACAQAPTQVPGQCSCCTAGARHCEPCGSSSKNMRDIIFVN